MLTPSLFRSSHSKRAAKLTALATVTASIVMFARLKVSPVRPPTTHVQTSFLVVGKASLLSSMLYWLAFAFAPHPYSNLISGRKSTWTVVTAPAAHGTANSDPFA